MEQIKKAQKNSCGQGEAGFIRFEEEGTKRGCGGIGHGKDEGKTRREELRMKRMMR